MKVKYPIAIRECGLRGALNLFASRRRLRHVLPSTGQLTFKRYKYPVHFRRVSTDKYVISEVLLDTQYSCLAHLPDVQVIVDAGANIGTASVFLLNAYPDARVIALEPDPGNFAMLERNLKYYGHRATPLRQALWHRAETLQIDRGSFRDGGEWATQVRGAEIADESKRQDAARRISAVDRVEGVTLEHLVSELALERIDILKVDIEGAERYVLNESLRPTLERVRFFAIELHDLECHALFARLIDRLPGELGYHGELVLWRNQRFIRRIDDVRELSRTQ